MTPLYLRNIELGVALPSAETLDLLLTALLADRGTLRAMLPAETKYLAERAPAADDPAVASRLKRLNSAKLEHFRSVVGAVAAAARSEGLLASDTDATWSAQVGGGSAPELRSVGPVSLYLAQSARDDEGTVPVNEVFASSKPKEAATSDAAWPALKARRRAAPGPERALGRIAATAAPSPPWETAHPLARAADGAPLAPSIAEATHELNAIYARLNNTNRHKFLARGRRLLAAEATESTR
jgi:hypothetical protein